MANLTRMAIIRSFERLLTKRKLEKITVKDIVENCNINRKTFYYYFSDIDDLLEKAFDYEVANFIDNVDKGSTIEEALAGFFGTMIEFKNVIYHVYNSSGSEHIQNYIGRVIYDMVYDDIDKSTKPFKITKTQKEIISNIYACIYSGLFVDWIDNGMNREPAEYIVQVRDIIKGMKQLMIQNAAEANQ